MTNFAVFLRGINVGGINIKMTELRTALAALPLTSFSTLLASGNIVCAAEAGAGELKKLVEDCLRENFGYDAWVVVLTQDQLAGIIAACPYPADNKEQHSYVTLASEPAVLDELEELGGALEDTELTRLSPESLAWLAPAGGTLDSPFSKLSSKIKYKPTTTTRNVRTLIKALDAMG